MNARQASVVIVKPAGTGTPSRGHLREAGALAAEQRPAAVARLIEVVDKANPDLLLHQPVHHVSSSFGYR